MDVTVTQWKGVELYHAGMAAHNKSPQQKIFEVNISFHLSSNLSTIQHVCSFEWDNDTIFIGDKTSVSNKDWLPTLDLLAIFIKYEYRMYTDNDLLICKVIPSMIVKFVFKLKIHFGFQLWVPSTCHAFGPRATPIIKPYVAFLLWSYHLHLTEEWYRPTNQRICL